MVRTSGAFHLVLGNHGARNLFVASFPVSETPFGEMVVRSSTLHQEQPTCGRRRENYFAQGRKRPARTTLCGCCCQRVEVATLCPPLCLESALSYLSANEDVGVFCHDGVMRSVHVLFLFVRSTDQSLRQTSNQASREARDTMDKCTMHGAPLFHQVARPTRDGDG